jgi:peroxiredoxin
MSHGRLNAAVLMGYFGLVACAGQQAAPTALAPSSSANEQVSSGAAPLGASEQTTVVHQPPDFELDSLDGDTIRLNDLLGKQVILLDFWATYCDPCLTAMPHLQAVYERYAGSGLTVLGISIDGPESIANVRSTVARLGVKFPILLDDESRVVAQYNPRTSAPFSVLIGRDGQILAQQEGFTTGNGKALEDAVAKAVAAPKTQP